MMSFSLSFSPLAWRTWRTEASAISYSSMALFLSPNKSIFPLEPAPLNFQSIEWHIFHKWITRSNPKWGLGFWTQLGTWHHLKVFDLKCILCPRMESLSLGTVNILDWIIFICVCVCGGGFCRMHIVGCTPGFFLLDASTTASSSLLPSCEMRNVSRHYQMPLKEQNCPLLRDSIQEMCPIVIKYHLLAGVSTVTSKDHSIA